MKKTGFALAMAAALVMVGCTDMTPRQQGIVSGGAMGSAAGAGIVAISGGNAWTGVAIGGVVGATAGNIKGGQR